MRGAAAFVDSGRRTTHKCYNIYTPPSKCWWHATWSMPKSDIRLKSRLKMPVRGSLSEYCQNLWYGRTRMVWLHDGEKIWRYVYSFSRIHEGDKIIHPLIGYGSGSVGKTAGKYSQPRGCCVNFRQISCFISEMARVMAIVTMQGK